MKVLLVAPKSPSYTALAEQLDQRGTAFEHLDAGADTEIIDERLRDLRDALVVDLASHAALTWGERSLFPFRRFEHLVRCCDDNNLPLLHLSDARVFVRGERKRFKEADTAWSDCEFAVWALQREQFIATTLERQLTLRVGPIFSEYGDNPLTRMIEQFQRGGRIELPAANKCLPTHSADLARVISGIIDQLACDAECWGLFHYASADAASCYEFAEMALVAASQYWDLSGVEPELTAGEGFDFGLNGPLINCDKIRDTFGIKQMPWRSTITSVVKKIFNARQAVAAEQAS